MRQTEKSLSIKKLNHKFPALVSYIPYRLIPLSHSTASLGRSCAPCDARGNKAPAGSVARNLLPLTGGFVTGWSHLQPILQKNMTKQPLSELSCCYSCAAVSINVLDASCGSLKTRLF